MIVKRINFIGNFLIGLSAVIFLAFYFLLSFYNRPASDDIVILSMQHNHSLIEYVNELYMTFCGRWTTCAYQYFVFSANNNFQQIHHVIFFYYLFSLVLFIYSTRILIKAFITKTCSVNLNTKTTLIYSVLFIAGFFYFTIDHMEVWWWICSSFSYLQGIIFLLFGMAMLIKEKKTFLHYILIALSFMFIGANFEIYVLIIFLLFTALTLYYFLKKKDLVFRLKYNSYLKGFTIAFILFSISASICFCSPGNFNRRASWNQNESSTFSGLESALFQKKFVVAVGITSFWFLLGMQIKRKLNVTTVKQKLNKILLIAALIVLLSILVTWMFQIFILYNSKMPLRAWTFTSFSTSIFCSILFLYFGIRLEIKSLVIPMILQIIIPFILVAVQLSSLINQYNYTNSYATEYDLLITQLLKEKKAGDKKTVYVKALPASGMLTYLDISTPFITRPLKHILELNYEIVVQK